MAEQFVIPQYLDVESKIGPITIRQFVMLMVTGLILTLFYQIFDTALLLTAGIPVFTIGVLFTFVKKNGLPFHYFLLNVLQTFRRPALRVWNKDRSDSELKARINKKIKPHAPIPYRKRPLSGSHLRDLSLVVNTGGVYIPDDSKEK